MRCWAQLFPGLFGFAAGFPVFVIRCEDEKEFLRLHQTSKVYGKIVWAMAAICLTCCWNAISSALQRPPPGLKTGAGLSLWRRAKGFFLFLGGIFLLFSLFLSIWDTKV